MRQAPPQMLQFWRWYAASRTPIQCPLPSQIFGGVRGGWLVEDLFIFCGVERFWWAAATENIYVYGIFFDPRARQENIFWPLTTLSMYSAIAVIWRMRPTAACASSNTGWGAGIWAVPLRVIVPLLGSMKSSSVGISLCLQMRYTSGVPWKHYPRRTFGRDTHRAFKGSREIWSVEWFIDLSGTK